MIEAGCGRQLVLTTREAAAMLGVSESRVRQFVRDGRLGEAIRLPREILLWRADVVDFASVPRRVGRPSGSTAQKHGSRDY